ncbi:MAG TPA: lactate racemase domain-containing protein [Terriglobia bacterium]|nr:lactate racemase domain-containing protein [Terriglobia bacterium]
MPSEHNLSFAPFYLIERSAPSLPALSDLEAEVRRVLESLSLPSEKLRGRRIAVTAGSRGVASLREILRTVCSWLRSREAEPFVFPAMGSHGGGTAEGQRKILEEYGVTPKSVGAEIISSMETVSLGRTPEGFGVHMDRSAWESDGVLIVNRIKPHTSFSGKIESGLLKMMAIGMAKAEGAHEGHLWSRKVGFEKAIRAMSQRVLASGKILAGLGVIENELHQVCSVRGAVPEGIVALEEEALILARSLVPRIPITAFELLIVDEMGKNISGTGMDTKVIGRGVKLQPGEAPDITLIYARDLTAESDGNALGIGLADLIHERLYRKIDLEKVYVNTRTSMNFMMARLPIHFPSDREALSYALGSIGSPTPEEQRVVWIRSTLHLNRMAVSAPLASQVARLNGWQLGQQTWLPQFGPDGNTVSPL